MAVLTPQQRNTLESAVKWARKMSGCAPELPGYFVVSGQQLAALNFRHKKDRISCNKKYYVLRNPSGQETHLSGLLPIGPHMLLW